jgi:preprotein translocase subunit SecF
MADLRDERSLGELFAELSRETGTLIRKEVELARVEMSERLSRVGRHAAFIGVGGAIAYAGVLALVAALVLLLVGVFELSAWVSALIVGVLVAVVGFIMINSAVNALKRESVKPTETIRTLKENAEWAKSQTK